MSLETISYFTHQDTPAMFFSRGKEFRLIEKIKQREKCYFYRSIHGIFLPSWGCKHVSSFIAPSAGRLQNVFLINTLNPRKSYVHIVFQKAPFSFYKAKAFGKLFFFHTTDFQCLLTSPQVYQASLSIRIAMVLPKIPCTHPRPPGISMIWESVLFGNSLRECLHSG